MVWNAGGCCSYLMWWNVGVAVMELGLVLCVEVECC